MNRYVTNDSDSDDDVYDCYDSQDSDSGNHNSRPVVGGGAGTANFLPAYVPKYRGGFGRSFAQVESSANNLPPSRNSATSQAVVQQRLGDRGAAAAASLAKEQAKMCLADLKESARRDANSTPDGRRRMMEADDWLRQLERQAIRADDLPEFSRALRRCFDSVACPWTSAWRLADAGSMSEQQRRGQVRRKQQFGQPNSQEFVCVSELIDWKLRQRQRVELPDWVKRLAFCLGYRGAPQFFGLVADAFNLTERPGALEFLSIIRKLIDLHMYKEAAQSAAALHLQDLLKPEDLVLPLIGQDKVGVAEAYLDPSPQAQIAALRCLDDALETRRNLVLELNDRRLPDLRADKLFPQQLRKLLDRLSKKFGLDAAAVCPARARKQTAAKVRFLLQQRLIHRCLSRAAMSERLEQLIDIEDRELQQEVVGTLTQHGSLDEALAYAIEDFCWDMQDLPQLLQDRYPVWCQLPASAAHEDVVDDEDTGSQDRDADYIGDSASQRGRFSESPGSGPILLFPLKLTDIALIESVGQFVTALGHIESACRLGVDAEWTNASSQCDVQLLQIAVEPNCRVYLFDVPQLLSLATADNADLCWRRLYAVLANRSVPKFGMGIQEDLRRLYSTVQFCRQSLCLPQPDGLVDLDGLSKRLAMDYPQLLHPEQSADNAGPLFSVAERGLSELSLKVLGRRLDKSEQLSDWSRRPLRPGQIVYAALDALCPLLVRQAVLDRASKTASSTLVEAMFLPVDKPVKVSKSASTSSNTTDSRNKRVSLAVGIDPALRGLDSRLRSATGDFIEIVCVPAGTIDEGREATIRRLLSLDNGADGSSVVRRAFLAAGGYCKQASARLIGCTQVDCLRIDPRQPISQQLTSAIRLLRLDSHNCAHCGCSRTCTLTASSVRRIFGRTGESDVEIDDWEFRDTLADGVDIRRGTLARTATKLWLASSVDVDSLDTAAAASDSRLYCVCVNCGCVTIQD